MPIQVYTIQTRGNNLGGNHRCVSKEEAEGIYNTLLDAFANDAPLVEVELGGHKMCARTKDITGFGIMVHLEETPEEIKARQIAMIEQGYQGMNETYPNVCTQGAVSGYLSSGGLL